MWVDVQTWEGYRRLCSREKLRPAEPIEEFLKLVLRSGSALTVLNTMRNMARARSENLEAYARVLLDWYTHDKFFVNRGGEEEEPVESLLLEALRNVEDPQLRREIEEALVNEGRRRKEKWDKEEEAEAGEGESEVEEDSEAEEAEDSEDVETKDLSVDEIQEKMNELKKIRGTLRSAKEA
jgi:hypothetical protein